MPRNFKLPFTLNVKDPRVAMRIAIGVLLAANLAAAIVAFKPFGGSAEDLRRQQDALRAQLTRTQQQLKASRELVGKVEKARAQGDEFLSKYFTEREATSAMILTELDEASRQAGIKMLPAQFDREEIVGSDTLQMLSTKVAFEGNYANLTKFVNLLDKSPRFMIIEDMQAAAPQQQGGQALSVTLKIDTFIKETATP
jgi:type IV pilus assembly protein PilO